jgi:dTDP-4-amino-4,6-dideoxygalactose transaminase
VQDFATHQATRRRSPSRSGAGGGRGRERFDAVSADLYERNLAIPMHAELTTDQVERVADVLLTALRNHAGRPSPRGG